MTARDSILWAMGKCRERLATTGFFGIVAASVAHDEKGDARGLIISSTKVIKDGGDARPNRAFREIQSGVADAIKAEENVDLTLHVSVSGGQIRNVKVITEHRLDASLLKLADEKLPSS